MDRWGKRRKIEDTLLEKISVDLGFDKPKGIVTGFIPACEFAEVSEIIANLAYLISNRGVLVCVLDFKVFYPNLFDWLGGVEANKRGDGLIRLLNSDRTAVKSVAQETENKNVFLVAPSPNDNIEDYLNFGVEDVARVISMLKEVFDVVLIDIPNNPSLEFCVGALMHCQRGFFVASERVDASRNIQKLVDYTLRMTNNIQSFNNLIIAKQQNLIFNGNTLTDVRMDDDVNGLKMRILTKLPFLREVQQCALDGKVYVRDGSLVSQKLAREGKSYTEGLNKIADTILEVHV